MLDFHKIRDYISGMDPATKAFLYEQGGKVLSAVWRAVSNRPRPRKSEETTQEAKASTTPNVAQWVERGADLVLTPEVMQFAYNMDMINPEYSFGGNRWHSYSETKLKTADLLRQLKKNTDTVFIRKQTLEKTLFYSVENVNGEIKLTDRSYTEERPFNLQEPIGTTPTRAVPLQSSSSLPTSEETTKELKRRLARELYKAELDLTGGLKIAGKACDCLQDKHALGIDATTEELISQDPRERIYYEIREWMERIQPIVSIEAINSGEYAQEYPILANEAKTFRKRLLGTESTGALAREAPTITLDEAKKLAAAEAAKEIERQWNKEA